MHWHNSDSSDRERIVVIRLSSLGDVLLTAPTIRVLRRRFPAATIHLMVAREFQDAASLIPGHDGLLLFDRNGGFPELLRMRSEISGTCSLIVDLQNSWRSAFLRATSFPALWVKSKRHRFRRWLLIRLKWNVYQGVLSVAQRYLRSIEDVGADDDGEGLQLEIPNVAKDWVNTFLGGKGITSGYVVLCPGAHHFTKRWPESNWYELAARIESALQLKVIVALSDEERDLQRRFIDYLSSATIVIGEALPHVAALFGRATAVVTNDSGLMHLAAGLSLPVVAIFGPTVEEFGFFPFRTRSVVLQNQLSCRPCTAFGGEKCPMQHFRCMNETTADHAFEALKRLLSR